MKKGVTTARKGDPRAASRGAAVARAKARLGDEIDRVLGLDWERMEMALLARVMGCDVDQAKARLKGATLEELEGWIEGVKGSATSPSASSQLGVGGGS